MRSPNDEAIVKTLSGMLIEMRDYERAERILDRYVRSKPNDMKAVADLASLYFRMEKVEQGMELIERIVATAPSELWPYQIGLDALIDNAMADEVLVFIGGARDALGDSTLFAIDAAQVYSDQGLYAKATWEYLLASTNERMGDDVVGEYLHPIGYQHLERGVDPDRRHPPSNRGH